MDSLQLTLQRIKKNFFKAHNEVSYRQNLQVGQKMNPKKAETFPKMQAQGIKSQNAILAIKAMSKELHIMH